MSVKKCLWEFSSSNNPFYIYAEEQDENVKKGLAFGKYYYSTDILSMLDVVDYPCNYTVLDDNRFFRVMGGII